MPRFFACLGRFAARALFVTTVATATVALQEQIVHKDLPDLLRNPQFTGCLKDDGATRRWLAQLLVNVGHLQDAAALGDGVVSGLDDP